MYYKSGLIIFVLLLNVNVGVIQSSDIPRADAVTFLGLEQEAQIVKKSVFAVQYMAFIDKKSGKEVPVGSKNGKYEWKVSGTGTLIQLENVGMVGLTCAHVVEPLVKNKKDIYAGLDTEKGYIRDACNIIAIDKKSDIAVIGPSGKSKEIKNLSNLGVDYRLFDDNSSLVEGRGVIIPGYPLSIGIEDDENHPVIRVGIIAQYAGKKDFLIDGVANHGNSGSPVFSCKGKDTKFLGMITSFRNETIDIYDEKGNLKIQLPYNSGLSIALTSNEIRKVLDKVQKDLAAKKK